YNQRSLTSVVIPSNVELIKEAAFMSCTSLTTVMWNAREKTVKAGAFWNCPALVNFNFKNLIETDCKAFSATGITNSYIGENDESITEGIKTVSDECFSNSADLETVGISGTVETIETKAFANCENLEKAVISDSVTEIADDAFINCPKLTIYCRENSPAHLYAKANGISVSTLVIDPIPNYVYTGGAIKPEISVSCSGERLEKSVDYSVSYSNNVNAGTANVCVNGKGDFDMLSSTAHFVICAKNISDGTVSSIPTQNYTGKEITPAVTVRVNGRKLVKGTDYDVTYYDNINEGTATARIRGKGNYSGTLYEQFEIMTISSKDMIRIKIIDFIRSIFDTLLGLFRRAG
ncbi:MAG: leucine-rich repeat domain-containing protein, partial [Clostridia bacterium]|nr:leucine-rich repeat domain-containing protein [Clostridia bacterium]